MKLLILAILTLSQVFALAIPTPTHPHIDLALKNADPTSTVDIAKRQSIIQVYAAGVAWVIGKIRDKAAPAPPQNPGPDASATSVPDADTYDYIITRTLALSGWADTIYEDLVAMNITTPGGRSQVEEFLEQHLDFLPQGWESSPIPTPCPSCFAGKNPEFVVTDSHGGKYLGIH